ncbi:IclR family transcriptional regulator [Humitalea sp. 24SJ18S-53]|uniref:IclR family transcriptional regulator n=1 Tax=Humitalea sp. 24SJ18S-53 TaxID=3422307 RepID=UPI003D66F86B
MKTDRDIVEALARGIRVLQCFTAARTELGGTEIAQLLKLPQSTVWRLCHTLFDLGLLVPGRDPDKLRPGPGVLTLGVSALTGSGIAAAALRPMQRLADQFGLAVSLAARSGTEMVVVQRAEVPSILRLAFHVGTSLRVANSALGCAHLAGLTTEDRLALIPALERESGAEWPAHAALIETCLAHYARAGYVQNFRVYHADVNAIGVPVISADGRHVLALNCGGAASVATPEMLDGPVAEGLKALARSLSPLLAERGA